MLAIKPGVRPLPQAGVAPHRQLVPPTAASLPRRLLHTGGGSKGPSVTAHTHTGTVPYWPDFLPERGGLSHLFFFTVSAACNRYPVATAIFWLKEVE